MKQTFTLEIDSSDYVKPVSVTYLMTMLRMGFNEARMGNLSILNISETTVEQNCGTPESINQKALDLLNKAAETIARLSDKLSDSNAYALGLDIEKHIRENTRER